MAGGEPEELPVDADASAPSLPLSAFLRRAGRWTGVAAQFFSVHAVLQAATLVSGLLFANLLPVDAFAAYALATSILVTFTFFTDLGVSVALNHFRHASLKGGLPYDDMLTAALQVRRRLFVIGAPVVAVAMWSWGRRVGAGLAPSAAMLVIVFAVVWWQVLSTTRVNDLRLRDQFALGYRAELAGAIARVTSTVAVLAAGLRDAWSAVATALAAAVVTAVVAGPSPGVASTPPRPEALSALVRYLLPTLPSALYFAVQGQVVIWLAAIFGGVSTLASVGALGRLGLVVGAFGGLISVVFMPRLVRQVDDRMFLRRFLQFGAVLVAVAGSLLALAVVAPGLLLRLIGPAYRGLTFEVQLMVLASGISLVASFLVQVNHARAWSRWQPVALVCMIAAQGVMAMLWPLDTTEGVMWFTVGSVTVGAVSQAVMTAIGFVRPSWVRW
jgi:O-antigen/teichoic acid export membrane protein